MNLYVKFFSMLFVKMRNTKYVLCINYLVRTSL